MESGWYLPRDIYVSDDEKDNISEGAEITETPCPVLDDLDDAVEAFGDGIGESGLNEGHDVLSVFR